STLKSMLWPWVFRSCWRGGVRPATWGALTGPTQMKQVMIFLERWEHMVHFHDLFQRKGQAFYPALCRGLYLLEASEKSIKFKQGHTIHSSPQLPHRSNGDRYL